MGLLPANVGYGSVTAKLIDGEGTPVTGQIVFTPTPRSLKNITAVPKVIILPRPVTATMVDGAINQTLIATDDPDNNPVGWNWTVSFLLLNAVLEPFNIEVREGVSVDLAEVAPVSASGGVPITRGVGIPPGGTTNQLLAKKSNVDYDMKWVTSTSGGSSDLSAIFPMLARNPMLLIAGNITRDANGAATSAPVVWPDGTPGVYTALALSSTFPGGVDSYKITYGTSPVLRTYTQPTITFNANGNATQVPAIVVS